MLSLASYFLLNGLIRRRRAQPGEVSAEWADSDSDGKPSKNKKPPDPQLADQGAVKRSLI
jgi:hypothetical protein